MMTLLVRRFSHLVTPSWPANALLVGLLLLVVSPTLYASWIIGDDFIHVELHKKPAPNTPSEKFAVTLRVSGFVDARKEMSPKKIGVSTQRIIGYSQNDLILDCDVSDIVTSSMKSRFDEAGFQVIDGNNKTMYELSGVITELTYNVKAQDDISISVESTLKEVDTGNVVWSGIVVEKPKPRFAGVSGNDKRDIANYLLRELGIVSQKTVDSIASNLMATRPDLFNLLPGTKAIAGVTVLHATGAHAPSVASTAISPASGTLILNTRPTRAKVYLDGVYYGMSPLRIEVETGIREVSVKLDGYKTAAEKVSVRKGESTELELSLER